MAKRIPTEFTMTLAVVKGQDLADVAEAVAKFFSSAIDKDDVLKNVGNPTLVGTPVASDPNLYLLRAQDMAHDMFTDDIADAVRDYVAQHGAAPEKVDDLQGYGDYNLDPQRCISEKYNIEDEMAGSDALQQAAAIIESGLFDEWKPSLDRGVWEEQDDPIQSVKNMADDLFKLAVQHYVEQYVKALHGVMTVRNQPVAIKVEDAIISAADIVDRRLMSYGK